MDYQKQMIPRASGHRLQSFKLYNHTAFNLSLDECVKRDLPIKNEKAIEKENEKTLNKFESDHFLIFQNS